MRKTKTITVTYTQREMILIKALAVSSTRRSSFYPELPTNEALGQIIVDVLREKQAE